MSERIGTRLRCLTFGKEGVVIAHTSRGVLVIEWTNGSVTAFTGQYEVAAHGAETFPEFRRGARHSSR